MSIRHWIEQQFHGNPLVTDPKPYLRQVQQSYRLWFKLVALLVSLAFVGIIFFVVGVINGWF